MEKIQKNYV